ncbi:iron uptake system protein EfeO [Spongisporangium articulatum]|uniref:Iron uptake system protein EfeO n=1 Tax=Spongisporangium articulatum TaxID=3362603 RepID=A0ABW8APJ3_9ACTN
MHAIARGGITATALALLVAGCGSSSDSTGTAAAGDPHTAVVTVTADKCLTDRTSYDAGAVDFKITNRDATAVSEVEVVLDERILAEKENLPPGFSGTFSVNLQPGTYQLYCPGAATERVPLVITGTATSQAVTDTTQLLQEGTKTYGQYVDQQVAGSLEAVTALDAAIKSGDVDKSKVAYAKARPFYERIEPVAESFAGLDPKIDARADDVPVTQLTGFHRIEYGLWTKKSTDGLEKYSAQLVTDTKELQTKATGLTYQPAELANGAVGLLDEVSKSKVTGEEERYSHIDLVDFFANVEGSQQAFANLKPGLNTIDPALTDTISKAFQANLDLLDDYRTTDNPYGWKLYGDLSKTDVKKLADSVQAIAEPLSRVASKVVDA